MKFSTVYTGNIIWNGYNKKRHQSSNLGGMARTVYRMEFQRPDMVVIDGVFVC